MPEIASLKLGCLPGQIPVGLKPLSHYVAGSLPKPPTSIAAPPVADWEMLGNDQYGDCGVAGLEHGFMAGAAVTAEQESFATAEQAVSYYLAYNKGQDVGVVLSAFLGYVRQHGYYGHTVGAFTHFSPQDIATLQSVVNLYDFSYTGIKVTQAMQQKFAAGGAWTLEDLLSPVAGGHCIPVVGYDDHHLYAVTWGKVQRITYPAWFFMATEAWAVMTGELDHGDGRGVAYDALVADLDQIAA
jgi:hypothetical protein